MEEANLQVEKVEQEQPEVIKRPSGVTFWGVLSIITGIVLLVMLIGWGQRIAQAANEFGLSGASYYFTQSAFIIVSLGGGIGMLSGKKYGWHLGTFLYFLDILRRINAILAVFQVAAVYGDAVWNSPRVATNIVGDIGGMIVDLFIIAYFFREYVLAYFDLQKLSKKRMVITFSGAAVIIYLIGMILNAVF